MKEDGRAAPIPLAPQHQQHQPLVMGHHHQQPHLPHSQINRKSPVTTTTTTAMDVHEAQPPVDNPSYTDSPALHVSVLQFKELEDECLSLRENNLKMKQQLVDSQRRERLMMRRLAAKEQELLDYVNQVAELKSVQTPAQTALKTAMLDPAVNVLFQKLKQELQATQARLEETQNELAAWKFTPDSNTGKRLMAKCRLLHQENEELGKLTSNGRLAKLESELAMQKGVSDDLKKSHCDLDEVLLELEEDVEGMQNTILLMQRELKVEKERNQSAERENGRMMAVLRDKPEWLAGVQARLAEQAAAAAAAVAAADSLKEDEDNAAAAAHRLNGGGMEVDEEEDEEEKNNSASAEPMDTLVVHNEAMAQRTRSGGVQVSSVDGRTCSGELSAEVVVPVVVDHVVVNGSSSGGSNSSNNGQSMATRKRTRSSVAVPSGGVLLLSSDENQEQETDAPPPLAEVVDAEEVAPLPTNCSVAGKRSRYGNNSNSEQPSGNKSAPRTRGQLQIESEKLAKLEVVVVEGGVKEDVDENEEPVVENGQQSEVVFSGSNNNNNNNGGKKMLLGDEGEGAAAVGTTTAEENGGTTRRVATTTTGADTVSEIKLKLENGSSSGAAAAAAAATGIDLRQEKANV